MRIVVSGAAGFIGSHLCRALLGAGLEVVGIDNFSFGRPENIADLHDDDRFRFIEADLLDPATLQQVQGNVLVHLASHKIPRYSSALQTLESNSKMLRNALQCCVSQQMKLVFASTSDVYGKNPHVPYHEESDLLLGPTTVRRWAYSTSKIYGELLIQAYHEDFGLDYTILRFFGSYGPWQNTTWWGGPQAVFIQNVLERKPIEVHGDGKQTRTFTYVTDTVQGIVKSITLSEATNQIFNVASKPDEEIAIGDLAITILELMGRDDHPIKVIPYSTFGKYEDVPRRIPDIRKITKLLDFCPTVNLIDGLKQTIRWQAEFYAASK